VIAGRIAKNVFNKTVPDPTAPRQDGKYSGKGEILFNTEPIPTNHIRHILGYVQQFDNHYPMLTVSETLIFHASLQLASLKTTGEAGSDGGGGTVTGGGGRRGGHSKMLQQVNRIIWLLGLKSCEHTRVGNEEFKGISGGEKRRLSIGIQLLLNPSICLLDEPTTGLDAFTAHHVMETLQHLSHIGSRTVIISIHQPRYDIFRLLDDLILLTSGGKQIWSGSTVEMLRHLDEIGYPCPHHMNPADFILDISSIDYRSFDNEFKSKETIRHLIRAYQQHQHAYHHHHHHQQQETALLTSMEDGFKGQDGHGHHLHYGTTTHSNTSTLTMTLTTNLPESPSFLTVFSLLFYRSYLNMIRQPIIASNRISQGVFFALILAAFYSPIGSNQNSIQDRIGCLYELTALMYIGMLSCIAIFPSERNVFLREYLDGTYSLFPFFFSYYLIALPMILCTSLLISLLMAYAIGLQPNLESLFQFNFIFFCFIFSGEAIGVIFCAIFMDVGFSVNLMSIFIGVTNQFAGFVSLSIPHWLNYVGYISPVKWGSVVLTNVVFHGETFTCSVEEEIYPGKCPLSTGKEVLDLYDMGYSDQYTRQFYLIMVGLLTGILFLASFIIFRIKLYHMSH
jgi:ABC-type multidrug transport system ATPase subunit